jgi:NAD(P)-dependent dehydrogenase (short-subunit alcohol dehydrogenase family)
MAGDGAPLGGRVAIVTGASRGIGRAVAVALADAGATLTLLARDERRLAPVAAELGARAITCDVSNAADIERVLATVREPPDILVNNAGLFELARVEETPPEAFEAALSVNLVAPFLLTRAFLPAMRARGHGDIVTIGSIADHAVFPENGAYAASKHGVRALHDVLRTELRGSGVRVTLVSPGPVDTPLWDPIQPDAREGFTPRVGMLSSEAVAAAVLYAVTQPPEVDVELVRLSHS